MTFKFITALFGYTFFVYQFEFAVGSMAFCFSSLAGIILHYWMQARAEKAFLKSNHELMFIVSAHPEDGRTIDFDPIIAKYVKHVPHHRVRAEARRIKDLYEELGNPWYDSATHGENTINVKELTYTHGTGVVYTWDEFSLHCHNEIKEAVKLHHEYLEHYDPWWYAEYSDNQKAYSGLYLKLSRIFMG